MPCPGSTPPAVGPGLSLGARVALSPSSRSCGLGARACRCCRGRISGSEKKLPVQVVQVGPCSWFGPPRRRRPVEGSYSIARRRAMINASPPSDRPALETTQPAPPRREDVIWRGRVDEHACCGRGLVGACVENQSKLAAGFPTGRHPASMAETFGSSPAWRTGTSRTSRRRRRRRPERVLGQLPGVLRERRYGFERIDVEKKLRIGRGTSVHPDLVDRRDQALTEMPRARRSMFACSATSRKAAPARW